MGKIFMITAVLVIFLGGCNNDVNEPIVEEPIVIKIDGFGDDWHSVDPIATDSENDLYDYDNVPVSSIRGDDIKAVYKVADNEYVYYMIEFWNPPPLDIAGETTLEIKWDTNPGNVTMPYGERSYEWTSNFSGYGFQVYELGLESIFGNTWFVDSAEIAVGDVIEIKIPLVEFQEFIRLNGERAEYLEEKLINFSEYLGDGKGRVDTAIVNNPMRTEL